MKISIKNNFKLILVLVLCSYTFKSCTNEFEYGNFKNAVNTLESSLILQTSATVSGSVVTDNGMSIVSRGICFNINNNPTIANIIKKDSQASLGNFSCTVVGLLPSTTYFARAYATNNNGTAYGKEITFKTLAATIPIISSTTAVGFITQTTAVAGGTITNGGASYITSKGVCWSNTNTLPTISNSKTYDGEGIGTFTSTLTSLSPNTIYYIRAYATNDIGTAYGDLKTFSTSTATIPIISTTTAASFISQSTAISGGTITSESGSTITSRGVCWSNTNSSPTITNFKTIDGAGIGTFTSSLTSLSPGITYYTRAYASNSVGTAYGPLMSFTTVAATIPIGVTTNTITSITQTAAQGGGNITSDGGATITSRGVCWSTIISSPTIINSKTIDGSGIGSFTSSLSGLSPNTTYYIRAYATNSVGTTYGTTMSFKTLATIIPTGITTSTITSITQTAAIGGGNITTDGGTTITSRGVCWSNMSSSPTIYNSSTNDGYGIGSFTSSFTGLLENTTYYVRAYATNSIGTSYGSAMSFKTLAPTPVPILGQSYQGGIIAYIFQSGDLDYITGETHGLIATISDQSYGAQWGCSGTSISTSTTLGNGQNNTTAIVNGCFTSSIAARICNDLVSGGYSDWYLPSYYELQKLYTYRTSIGGFSSTYYWSSSQTSTSTAFSVNFSNGNATNTSKSNIFYVRAIRKF